ncbi:MAG: hypothetical protein QOE11_2575, partial [Solirubrobacteraceae bacterium]|nr:hypothetical protein [Solirubrobacteraceae bacterium]
QRSVPTEGPPRQQAMQPASQAPAPMQQAQPQGQPSQQQRPPQPQPQPRPPRAIPFDDNEDLDVPDFLK